MPRFAFLFLSLSLLLQSSLADIGTGAQYLPPYTPTACFGDDRSQFPVGNLFAAAGEGIWDNGAACGRQYLVRCISGPTPGSCNQPSNPIQVRIVDRAQSSTSPPSRQGTSLVLSNTAFQAIADPTASFLNIEFQQV